MSEDYNTIKYCLSTITQSSIVWGLTQSSIVWGL